MQASPGTPMGMLDDARRSLQLLRHAPAGRRFRRYNLEKRCAESSTRRLVMLSLAAALAGVGAVMLVTPGPGILFLAWGGALAAARSKLVARTLDVLEMTGRDAWGRLSQTSLWQRCRKKLKTSRSSSTRWP